MLILRKFLLIILACFNSEILSTSQTFFSLFSNYTLIFIYIFSFIIMDELRIATTWSEASLTTQEFNTAANFSIYPNPTNTGFVNITTKANTAVNVTVFDVLGKQVLSKTLNNNILDITSLTTGVYILKLNQNGTSTTKRLIVE